ncbi:MAG: PA14 domain-containing protein [Ardenticatenaceae bacterium]|nr:PA14 domain-containing protein [Ardenticatenaceae bacterium]
MRSRFWPRLFVFILLVVMVLPLPAAAQGADAGWIAEYWPNRNLDRAPVVRALVPDLNINWGLGSPDDLPVDNFSARFTRQVTFPGGPVRFFARSDDGIRLWVDNALLIDRWTDHPAQETYTAGAQLAPGTYTIRVEYYEHLDRAEIHVWWQAIPPEQQGAWTAQYWANQNLAGDPVLTTQVTEVNFQWGRGSPAPVVPSDHFSARFTRTVTLLGGDYRFFARADDGVRLWLDGWLVIDQWRVGPATVFQGDFEDVGAGDHTIRVEYFEQTGDAVLQVWWQRINAGAAVPGEEPWRGAYFANRDLTGQPVVVTQDPAIDYDWGTGAPYASLPADNFSVRWTKTVFVPSGDYEFIAEADDGVRVWLDGWLVINNWTDGPARISRGVFRRVGAGPHTLTVEYYEHTGVASISFRWHRLP